MSQTTQELSKEMKKSLDHMRTLRDEVRVRLHLAGMDAKDEWQKLEPYLADVERAASDLSESARVALSEAIQRLTKLRSSLGRPRDEGRAGQGPTGDH